MFERIKWFFARGQMDVDRLGEKLIEALHDAGKLTTFADIYRLSRDDLLAVERMGKKAADNVLAGIEASKSRPLNKLIHGLGIRHVGGTAGRLFAERFGSFDAIKEASVDDLAAVEGIGDVIAGSLRNWLDEGGVEMVEELQSLGLDPKQDVVAASPADGPLAGKSVVVTGSLEHFTRETIQERIRQLGGKAGSSVSKRPTSSSLATRRAASSKRRRNSASRRSTRPASSVVSARRDRRPAPGRPSA